MENNEHQLPPYHQAFIRDLQAKDSIAFDYFQDTYSSPLVITLLSITRSFPESFQLMLKVFRLAEKRISEYKDDSSNSLFFWLLRIAADYLQKTPGKTIYYDELIRLVNLAKPPY